MNFDFEEPGIRGLAGGAGMAGRARMAVGAGIAGRARTPGKARTKSRPVNRFWFRFHPRSNLYCIFDIIIRERVSSNLN